MKKRRIVALFIVLLFVVPAFNATQVEDVEDKRVKRFVNCYIEVSGEVRFTFQFTHIPIPLGLGKVIILYWPIVFIGDSEVTIYSEENGKILYHEIIEFEHGNWIMHLVGFRGFYNNYGSTDDELIVNLEGKALYARLKTE